MYQGKLQMTDSTKIIETEHHVIEIDSLDYVKVKEECKLLNISIDYYFFEFQMWEGEVDV